MTARTDHEWKPQALAIISLFGLIAVVMRLLPPEMRVWWNITPIGGLAVFAGARLRLGYALLVPVLVMAVCDTLFYATKGWYPSPYSYLGFAAYVVLGYLLARKNGSLVKPAVAGLTGYVLFFFITNTGAWIEPALPEYAPQTWQTLLLSYRKGLEFMTAQDYGVAKMLAQVGLDVITAVGLVALHARLARQYNPAELPA